MKKVNLVLTLLGVCLMMSSCVLLRGGVAIGSERYSYDPYDIDYGPQPQDEPAQKATSAEAFANSNSEVGFYVGLGLTGVEIFEKFSFAPEVNFIGVKNLEEVQVPILVSYEIIDRLSAHAGPAVGIFLDPGEGLKSTTFGFDMGADYEIMDDFSVQARFDLGLSNIYDTDYGKLKYSTLQFGVAYRF